MELTIYEKAFSCNFNDNLFCIVVRAETNSWLTGEYSNAGITTYYIGGENLLLFDENLSEKGVSEKYVFTEMTGIQNYEQPENEILAEVVFWNKNEYTEFIAENTDCLGIDLKLKIISEQEQFIQPYIALYENNKLCDVKVCTVQSLEVGEETSYREEFTIDTSKTESYTVYSYSL